MKHAFLVIAHSEVYILNILLNQLQHPDITIFVHCDYKSELAYEIEKLTETYGGIYIKDRISVYWGTDSQIKCELKMFKTAFSGGYDYYHLVSGADLLVKPVSEFLSFIEKHSGQEFFSVDSDLDNMYNAYIKMNYHYFFLKKYKGKSLISRVSRKLSKLLVQIQRLIGFRRVKDGDIKLFKGHNWVSLTNHAVGYILSKEDWITKRFQRTFCPDEIYKQTILMNSHFADNRFVSDDLEQSSNLRLIDWNRGTPYLWRAVDKEQLLTTSNFIARKFSTNEDKSVIDWLSTEIKNNDTK